MQGIFGVIKCPECSANNKISRDAVFTARCINSQCQNNKPHSLVPHIVNLVTKYMFEFSRSYYSPKRVCLNCDREWDCSVSMCKCLSRDFDARKSEPAFHENLYLIKKVLLASVKKDPETSEEYYPLYLHIKETLKHSGFERIKSSLFRRLKFPL